MTILHLTALFLLALLATHLLLKVTYRYALKHLLDTPNERSSHTIPTPRGGGIAVSLSSLTVLIYFAFTDINIPTSELTLIAIASGTLAALGYADDHLSLSRRLRFGVTLAALAASVWLLPSPNLQLGHITLTNSWILFPLLLLASTWFLNLFNFMDGIDGIASVQTLTALIGAALILLSQGEHNWSYLLIVLSAPALGFLIWNFPPAKIFLGDSGSYFWGALIALLAITTAANTQLNIWSWIILLGVFIADSSWTLTTRILTKQQWNSPHRSHAYQKLSRRFNSHRTISLSTGIITLLWLTPWAYASTQAANAAWIFTIVAYIPLLLICRASGAGRLELKD